MTDLTAFSVFFDYGLAGGVIMLLVFLVIQFKKEARETRSSQMLSTQKYVDTVLSVVEKQERECASHILELKTSTKERTDELKKDLEDLKRETRQWKEEDKGKVFAMLGKHGDDMINLTKSINGLINEIKNH